MAISEDVGSVATLWRFPVKSMGGEQLQDAEVTERGVLGDRAYALIDKDTGKVVSAKSVRLFPNLLDCKAAFVEPPRRGGDLPAVQILLPGSTTVRSDSGEVDRVLSVYFKRNVTLGRAAPDDFTIDQYHPDIEGADPGGNRDTVVAQKLGAALFAELGMESPVAVGSFFAVFPLSVLTMSTGRPASCRFFRACAPPLVPDDVDARTARRGSAPESLRPAQVPHERDC